MGKVISRKHKKNKNYSDNIKSEILGYYQEDEEGYEFSAGEWF